MKCESCSVQIGAEFAHAIQNNQCPACGDSIMQQVKLASYLSLRTLLANNFENIDAERIATLVVANFELRQIFKEELQKVPEEGNIEVEEDDGPDEVILEDGVKLEKPDKKKVQAALKKMRDETFNEAVTDQYGTDFTDSELLLAGGDGGGTHELANNAKRERSLQALESGSGSVKRSG